MAQCRNDNNGKKRFRDKLAVNCKFALFCCEDFVCWFLARLCLGVVFLARLMLKKYDCQKKRILVFANQPIGDAMIKLPAFMALRRQFPRNEYHIAAVLARPMVNVFLALGCFDEIIEESLPPCKHVIFWMMGRRFLPSKSLRWAVRNKVDIMMVCDRHRDLAHDFAHFLCRPRLSIAYYSTLMKPIFPFSAFVQGKFYDKLYTHLLEPSFNRHQLEDAFAFVSFALGRSTAISMPDSSELQQMIDYSKVEELGLQGGEYVVLVPGAGAAYRRWPTRRFAELIMRVPGKYVVVGTKEEASLAKEIASCLRSDVVDICGKTTVRQLLGIISCARVVIANETGTATCAAILGAKTVCILGGGDFGSFFPNRYCANTVSVFHKENCFSCGWQCCKGDVCCMPLAPCIDAIRVDDVVDAVRNADRT